MKQEVHVWHVEMTERPDLSKANRPYDLRKTTRPLPELNRFLYGTVGAPWCWYVRLTWNYQQWMEYLDRDVVHTWVAYQGATPVGYFELEEQAAGSVEIAYFGLLPEFTGEGLGKLLLEDALYQAWLLAENRVWLHTCTLDHPAALPNYLARGFKVFLEEDTVDEIPDEALEVWSGAEKPGIT